MVNEQRLHSMIKIAKFDANDGKRCKPMIQYARKDYVALQLLKSFVVGTIAFFMMLGLWVLYSMDALMEQINKMDFVKAATTLGLLYGIFMVIYLLATYIIFNMKYTYGRKKVKKYYAGLKALVFQSSLRMNLPLPLYTFRKSAPSGSVCRNARR